MASLQQRFHDVERVEYLEILPSDAFLSVGRLKLGSASLSKRWNPRSLSGAEVNSFSSSSNTFFSVGRVETNKELGRLVFLFLIIIHN